MPSVTIIRSEQYEGRMRKMKILVDGNEAGTVRDGKDLTISVPSGKHELIAKMDWCKARLGLDLSDDDEQLHVETGFLSSGLAMILHPAEAIFLRVADFGTTETQQ